MLAFIVFLCRANEADGCMSEKEVVMKSVSMLSILVSLIFVGCSHSTEPINENPVAYKAYTGYSYCGPRPASDTTLFFQTTTKNGFDSLFYFISDHNPSPTIPLSDLSVKKVVSIVKYGNNYYLLQVTNVTLVSTTLKVYYESALKSANITWVAAIPLILTLDASYQSIDFIENGTQVKKLTL
jgi:hypothetical protein